MTADVTGATLRRGRAWPIVAVVLGVVVVVGIAVRDDGRRSGPPYDPRATDPGGALAFVELLGSVGLDADGGPVPLPGRRGTVVLLDDDLSPAARAALGEWVEAGGTLVVADVDSSFAPLVVDSAELTGSAGPCRLDGLADVDDVDLELARGFHPGGGPVCFPVGSGSLVVRRSLGAGEVVAVGARTFFRNDRLGVADHAVLAVRLAQTGPAPVRVLVPAPGAEGGDGLRDLVSPGVWALLAQAAVAFVVYAVVRAWRFGHPVTEVQPVAVDGSELVVATGRLFERSRASGRSADLLHADLRGWLRDRYGIPMSAEPSEAIGTLSGELAGTGLDRSTALRAVATPEVDGEAALVDYAAAVAGLRHALTEGTSTWTT